MVVLLCNGRTNGNAYLVIFKVGPLRARTRTHAHAHTHTGTRTHLLHRSCHCWKHRRKESFGIFQSSALAFDLMPSMVEKRVPFMPMFGVRKNQKSLWVRSGGYGGWVMTGIAAQQAMCGSVRYRDAETTVEPLPPNCIEHFCKTCS
jgi:hypothetical protein